MPLNVSAGANSAAELKRDKCLAPDEPEDFLFIQRALTKEACALFATNGYLVVDNAIGAETRGYLQEIAWLMDQGMMVSNCTATMKRDAGVTALSQVIMKPHIYEAELIRPEIRALVPRLANLFENGGEIMLELLQRHMPQLKLSKEAGGASIKLQYNEGEGGCFPLHYDGPGGTKDSRRVTALVYLNPDWKPEHGGHLRLYPFMQAPVDIEPVMDRMVLFFSDRSLHRTLPSTTRRVCFTIWFHGTSEEPPLPANISGHEEWMAALQQPATQRLVSHALYDEEYMQSLKDAHASFADALLDMHKKDVAAISAQPGLSTVVGYLKEFMRDLRPLSYEYIKAKNPMLASIATAHLRALRRADALVDVELDAEAEACADADADWKTSSSAESGASCLVSAAAPDLRAEAEQLKALAQKRLQEELARQAEIEEVTEALDVDPLW